MKLRSKKTGILLCVIILAVGLVLYIHWANTALEVNEYEIASPEIPESFDGFRIAQISDFHNSTFGENNSTLLALLASTEPDIIVITGDLIDSRRTDIPVALEFARQATLIAPVYYVSGNHEARIPAYRTLRGGLTEAGVTVLGNQKTGISREDATITLMGIEDPSFYASAYGGDTTAAVLQKIRALQEPDDGFTILLSHRPELYRVYVACGVNLVFSGHAHGGQVRLPLVGGLVAPNQGFFPEYDAGTFSEGSTTMLVSRGIGNSIIPIRVFNRPEILVAELRTVQ